MFDTTGYTVTAGPSARFLLPIPWGSNYSFALFSQGKFRDFTTHTGQGTWRRSGSREISSTVNGGMSLIEPIPATQSNDPNIKLLIRGKFLQPYSLPEASR